MLIQLKNISKKYKDNQIFDNFSLNINEGEMVAITGRSGKGKSTLLNMIGLLDTPDTGDIIIKGIYNPGKSEKEQVRLFRYTIGYLFQNYALIEQQTVSENLDIALKYVKCSDKTKRKEEVLEQVGLFNKLDSKVYQLSGGEQQRVALARLLLKQNDIILADEPTGSLDKANRNHVLDILKSMNSDGKTVIIVTHDPEVAHMCNKIIEL